MSTCESAKTEGEDGTPVISCCWNHRCVDRDLDSEYNLDSDRRTRR